VLLVRDWVNSRYTQRDLAAKHDLSPAVVKKTIRDPKRRRAKATERRPSVSEADAMSLAAVGTKPLEGEDDAAPATKASRAGSLDLLDGLRRRRWPVPEAACGQVVAPDELVLVEARRGRASGRSPSGSCANASRTTAGRRAPV